MRELSDDFKISARSLAEVSEIIGVMVSRYRASREVTYRGGSITKEALVNAAILYIDSLPKAERSEALAGGIRRLEAMLAEIEPAVVPPSSQGNTVVPVPKKGRRKSG